MRAPPWFGPRSRATRAEATVSSLTVRGRKAPSSSLGLVAPPPARTAPGKASGTARAASGLLASGVLGNGCYPPRSLLTAGILRPSFASPCGPPPGEGAAQRLKSRARQTRSRGGAPVPQGGGPGSSPKIKRKGDTTRNLKADVPSRRSGALDGRRSFPCPPRLSPRCYRRAATRGLQRASPAEWRYPATKPPGGVPDSSAVGG